MGMPRASRKGRHGMDDLTPLARVGETARREAMADAIRAALKKHKGNVTAAAEALGVKRVLLYRYAKSAGIDLTIEAERYRD